MKGGNGLVRKLELGLFSVIHKGYINNYIAIEDWPYHEYQFVGIS